MGNLQEIWTVEIFKNDIKRIVSKISRIDVAELDDRLLIREELGIDSLMAMEIIANCEKRFGVVIDESRYAEIETIGDYLGLVESLVRRNCA